MQSHRQYLKLTLAAVVVTFFACATEEKKELPPTPQEQSNPKTDPNRSYGISEYEAAVNTFKNGNFADAAKRFETFIKTKASSRFYLDAYLWLGQAYMELKRFDDAKNAFTHYSTAKGPSPEGFNGRIWAGKALLAKNKAHEALLLSLEIIDLPNAKRRMELSTYLTAFLLRAESLMQLGKELQASQALDAYRDESRVHLNSIPKEVSAYANNLEIRHKINTCEKLPEKKRLEEQQVRSQLQRRGICLYETIPIYEKLLTQRVYPRIRQGINEIVEAYSSYKAACLSPPLPKKHRTKLELDRYKEELADVLKRDCQSYVKRATYLLESWLSPDTRHFDAEDPLNKYVRELLTRIDKEYTNGNKRPSS